VLIGFLFYFLIRKRRRSKIALSEADINTISIIPEAKEDEFLIKLKIIVDEKMNDSSFSMFQLCRAIGISRAQVYRKVKKLTGKSPSLYIRSLRLQKAKTLLMGTDLNISEIGYEVGFKDLSYFSRSFTEEYGTPPSEMRKKN